MIGAIVKGTLYVIFAIVAITLLFFGSTIFTIIGTVVIFLLFGVCVVIGIVAAIRAAIEEYQNR